MPSIVLDASAVAFLRYPAGLRGRKLLAMVLGSIAVSGILVLLLAEGVGKFKA